MCSLQISVVLITAFSSRERAMLSKSVKRSIPSMFAYNVRQKRKEYEEEEEEMEEEKEEKETEEKEEEELCMYKAYSKLIFHYIPC